MMYFPQECQQQEVSCFLLQVQSLPCLRSRTGFQWQPCPCLWTPCQRGCALPQQNLSARREGPGNNPCPVQRKTSGHPPVSHCTPLGNFIPALKCPLRPTSCVVFCLLWLFLKNNFTFPTLPKTMVSESWEKFRSRESNPLSSPKLPTFLQEENHLPRTVLPACTIWPLRSLPHSGNCRLCSCLGP